MSILKKPYEISVWDDIWDANQGKFVERKICIIGSDKMESQSRVLEPNFTRNVNGVKKLSFKLYKKYIDVVTGEKIDNVFAPFLVNERKVKLKYGTYTNKDGEECDRWYDFIIKNISETSVDYLYTYQLEDALVQELSKNGYNIALDSQLQNNLGTAKELATSVLEETDWVVADDSEVFVQKIEESLVYLKVKVGETIYARRIIDQSSLLNGVSIADTYTEIHSVNSDSQKIILGFYSSCTEKPHRFQFIYVNPLSSLERDEKRIITNENCQYFIECEDPDNDYVATGGFYLPRQLEIAQVDENSADGVVSEVTLSGRYRGARYGFSHQAKYIPELDRYVNLFDKFEYDDQQNVIGSTLYYGFENTEYISPTIIQNLVSSADFSSTSGWIASKKEAEHSKAVVETVYGRFEGNSFKTCTDDIHTGKFQEKQAEYKSYLKMTFPRKGQGVIVNSGPFDMRTTIKNLVKGDQLAMRYVCYQSGATEMFPVTNLNIEVGEYIYDKNIDGYISKTNPKLAFGNFEEDGDYYYSTISGEGYSEEDFKKESKIRICISSPLAGTYYLEKFELFKAIKNANNELIIPDSQSDNLTEGIIKKKYLYFEPSALTGITNLEQLKPEEECDRLTYIKYKPRYNTGAEKTRTISIKESNYFNILQAIAETFEAWLLLEIERNSEGAIVAKKVKFKNYAGGNNYAGFRYGVNLKDIQRTYESKNIVTKLIVKQNNNEYGKDGFCTIARAGANPSGETSIYDFQYYFNQGLLDETTYNNTLYAENSTEGLDGYFPRIKAINNQLIEKNKEWSKIASDLTQYKAKLVTAEAGYEAATSGIEEVRTRFKEQFNVEMEGFDPNGFEITTTIKNDPSGTITDIQLFASKDKRTKKWYISGTLFRDSTEGGIESTATIELTQKFATEEFKQDIVINYNFVDGLNFTGAYAEFNLSKLDLSSTESLYQELSEYYNAERQYRADYIKYNSFVAITQAKYDVLSQEIEELKSTKLELNKLFFSRYSRFLQEGTWMDEKYYDDNLYYADALSVMYNSCYPQVAYNINVLELSALPGYEHFEFNPGEKTYAEDLEFFGSLRREEVIIAELSENLDDPSKNTIRVQNFKNQFQDLFQKITATVQQAQYSTGAYEKAVALAESGPEEKSAFLTGALDTAETMLQTAGQQSVTWGNDGITVKRVDSPSNAIRMVGGAILLSKQDENGEQKWVTGITTEGISASLVTAGTVNTSIINIMNGDEPAFRWNTYGISAFDDTTTTKFVRFDKYGIYGVQGVDGLTWAASNLDEVREKATFYQTWDGIQIMPQNAKYKNGEEIIELVEDYKIKLGYVDDSVFNKWGEDGTPEYDPESQGQKFVKLFSVGHQVQGSPLSENFVLYSDGTLSIENLKLPGTIEWTSTSSPLKTVYAKIGLAAPANETKFNTFYPNDEEGADGSESKPYRWHTVPAQEDKYYARTEDGGKTWTGPFLLNGFTVTDTQTKYAQGPRGADPNGLEWQSELPVDLIPGKCLYTRIRDIYNDDYENPGEWRYLVTLNGSPGQMGEPGPAGPKGDDGTSVSIQPSAEECTEIGQGYIDENGNFMVLTSLDPREFTNAGKIRGPQGPTIEQITIYQANNNTVTEKPLGNTPNLPTNWSESPISPTSNAPYIWKSQGQKITTYNSADGTVEAKTYGNNWTTPELWAAYSGTTGINEQNYATYLRITNFSNTDGLYYGTGADEGKLCINASFLKSGTILVGDDVNNPVFSADVTNKIVTIGGWTVQQYSIQGEYKGDDYISTLKLNSNINNAANWIEATYQPMESNTVETRFSVSGAGLLTAKGANISGDLTADSLTVGTKVQENSKTYGFDTNIRYENKAQNWTQTIKYTEEDTPLIEEILEQWNNIQATGVVVTSFSCDGITDIKQINWIQDQQDNWFKKNTDGTYSAEFDISLTYAPSAPVIMAFTLYITFVDTVEESGFTVDKEGTTTLKYGNFGTWTLTGNNLTSIGFIEGGKETTITIAPQGLIRRQKDSAGKITRQTLYWTEIFDFKSRIEKLEGK